MRGCLLRRCCNLLVRGQRPAHSARRTNTCKLNAISEKAYVALANPFKDWIYARR